MSTFAPPSLLRRAASAGARWLTALAAAPAGTTSLSVPSGGLVARPRSVETSSTYPGRDITIAKLSAAWRDADGGRLTSLMELAEDLEERYPHLAAVLQTRKLAVTGRAYSVVPGPGGDERIAVACRDMLSSLPSVREAWKDSLDGLYKGFAVSEIEWAIRNDGLAWPVAIHWRHQKTFTRVQVDPAGEPDVLRRLTTAAPFAGVPLEPAKWIVHTPRLRSSWRSRDGLIRPCSLMYLVAWHALVDWSAFVEVFGTPLRIGKYAEGTRKEEIAKLKTALVELGTDGAAVLSQAVDLSIEARGTTSGGDQVQERLTRYGDATVTKVVLGHVASADAVSGSLGGAEGSSLQVRQDIRADDAGSLDETWRRDLLRWFVEFNWGPAAPIPYQVHSTETPEEELARAKRDEILLPRVAYPDSYFRNSYRIPEPRPGEPTVGGPAGDSGTVGAQVGAVMAIVDKVASGGIARETGIEIYLSIFGGDPAVAQKVIPEPPAPAGGGPAAPPPSDAPTVKPPPSAGPSPEPDDQADEADVEEQPDAAA